MSEDRVGEPTPVGEALRLLTMNWVVGKCPQCGRDTMRLEGAEPGLCAGCREATVAGERVASEYARLMQNMEPWLTAWLLKAGLSRRELTATVAGIPAPVRRAIGHPALGVQRMLQGECPEHGFGLSGTAGTGKTFALAAAFRDMAAARWRLWGPTEGLRATRRWLCWLHWPEATNRMRVEATKDGGLERVENWVARWADVECLMLDDMGAERMRTEYGEDWATAQLDLLVDSRYNNLRPTWWTTNLHPDEFMERYGARLFSRLCGANALVRVPDSADMRMGVVKGGKA